MCQKQMLCTVKYIVYKFIACIPCHKCQKIHVLILNSIYFFSPIHKRDQEILQTSSKAGRALETGDTGST